MINAIQHDPERSIDGLERTSILFVDAYAAGLYVPSLRTHVEVTAVTSEEQALRALTTIHPSLIVTELDLADGDGLSLCRRSKAGPNPPAVLVTTSVPERVPDALIAGCDGVLLKPFVPNLLYGRIGRLLRQRAAAVHEGAMWERARTMFAIDGSAGLMKGTNIVWPHLQCLSCGQGGTVSFDASGQRRLWYACLGCRTVWLGPPGEA